MAGFDKIAAYALAELIETYKTSLVQDLVMQAMPVTFQQPSVSTLSPAFPPLNVRVYSLSEEERALGVNINQSVGSLVTIPMTIELLHVGLTQAGESYAYETVESLMDLLVVRFITILARYGQQLRYHDIPLGVDGSHFDVRDESFEFAAEDSAFGMPGVMVVRFIRCTVSIDTRTVDPFGSALRVAYGLS